MEFQPEVLNKRFHKINPDTDVFIGRPTIWGNPYPISKVNSREKVIAKYREYLEQHPEVVAQAKIHLKGKNLVCFCAPLPCHGHVLIEVANSD